MYSTINLNIFKNKYKDLGTKTKSKDGTLLNVAWSENKPKDLLKASKINVSISKRLSSHVDSFIFHEQRAVP